MMKQSNWRYVEPELLAGWLGARSIARGLPQPVPDHGGMRVDTGLPSEKRRYVFAGPVPRIRELALSITAPCTFIKMCGPCEQLLALVPPRWQLQPGAYLMTHSGARDAIPTLPAGYRLEVLIKYPTTAARIFAEDGCLAASGYAVEYGGVFILDRIVTETAHRRRGLGRALMAALGSTQQSSAARRVLVATDDGRALYSSLGWVVHSPYSTIAIAAFGN
jgi:GNAT superfamily N-acetyltransferase